MKKSFILITCMTLLFLLFKPEQSYASNTTQIDTYIKINSVTKGKDKIIKVNYTVKKTVPDAIALTISSYWKVYNSKKTTKTIKLSKKKGTYNISLKAEGETIGPQYVEVKASVSGGRYIQLKKFKTYYKLPAAVTRSHTVTKKQAVAQHFMITAGALSFKVAAKRSPYGVALNLISYGMAGTYTLKSLNVVGGYPSPAAGQYIRTTSSYNTKGSKITMQMWTNEQSYKKGVKPIYSYNQTHPW